ncbi:hypothetical protein JCM15908A_11080 [Prevotella dentasini JCM 15908]
MFALSTTAQAQERYDLMVAGVWVTSDNCDDLTVVDGVEGVAQYDPETKTLTLENATIRNSAEENGYASGVAFTNTMDGLTVNLVGNNTIISENSMGMFNFREKQLILTGGGSLKVSGAETATNDLFSCGILNRGSMVVKGCTVEATGGISGINHGNWEFDSCTVRVKGGGSANDEYAGSMGWLHSQPTFKNCILTAPAEGVWRDFTGDDGIYYALFGSDGKVFTDWITIAPITEVENYGFYVAGVQVTSENCNSLTDIPGVEGTVKYDHSSKTLTLENATIRNSAEENGYASGVAFTNTLDGLTVNLVGNNTFISEKSMGMFNFREKQLTLTGGGSLKVSGAETAANELFSCGILNRGSMVVKGCTVEATGGISGINHGNWEFDGCTVRVKGGGSANDEYAGSMGWLHSQPTFKDCGLISPKEGVWKDFTGDDGNYYSLFGSDGKVFADWITIAPIPEVENYGFSVAGVQVTSENFNSLTDIPGVEGTVKYDHDSKTLTLENATIRNTAEEDGNASGTALFSTLDGFVVNLVGSSTIISDKGMGLCNADSAHLTLMGSGTLKVNGSAAADGLHSCGIQNNGYLTVKDCVVEVAAGVNGICKGVWTFDNCIVRVKGGGSQSSEYAGSISSLWDKPTFNGCSIIAPEGTYLKDFMLDGGKEPCYSLFGSDGKVVTSKVVISTEVSGINTVPVGVSAGEQGIYNMHGMRMNGNFDQLPAGIYIVDGKKVVKK